ncbi:MAG: flagellar protein FlbB [Pseudomonadota bacterium]|nr:flagellar protein FlbB [Pseudomonadota bacterium]
MTSRVRVLPLMIIVMFLMFSEKASNIWQNASVVDFGSGIEFKPALAQQSGSGDAPQSAPGPGDGPADSEGLPPGSRPLEETNKETPIVGDPNRFSEREVQLLQELAERRNVLDAREQQLEEREALLKAAEQRLLEKQTVLNSTKDEIKALLKKQDKQEKAKINQLVAIYENMKPKDAANIFNELEMPVLLQVIKNMKERKVAPVIASMSAEKARLLTKELADQQKLPTLPN